MRELLAAMREPGTSPAALVPAGQRRVRFSGERGGDGPLTIGQGQSLSWVRDTSAYARMIEWALDLPEGTTLDDIAAAFGVLMARHESLRTTYPPGEPRVQRVARSGELAIRLYRATSGHNDPLALTAALTAALRAGEFNLAGDLPLRVGVVMDHTVPIAAVVLYSHMAVDLGAMAVIGGEFTELAADPASRLAGPPRHQPLDQAAAEQSPAGRRRTQAALRTWRDQLRKIPQCMYPAPRQDPGAASEPLVGWLWSAAAAQALPHITERTGAGPQTAVFAAVCAVLAARTGEDCCWLACLMHNRFDRRLRDHVGVLAGDTPVCTDTGVPGFDDLLGRAGTLTLKAAKGGLADRTELERIVAQVEDERGIFYAQHCVYNDLTYVRQDAAAPSGQPTASPADAAAALAQTELRWLRTSQTSHLLGIFLGQVTGEVVLGAATAVPDRVPRSELELILRGVELLLVAAASGEVAMADVAKITGVTPFRRGPGWLRTDSCWIETAEAQRLVDDALTVPAVRVFTEHGPGGPMLVAYLAAGDKIRTPEQAHAACLAVLRSGAGGGRRYTAKAPASYVVCGQPPSDLNDPAAWQHQPVLACGSGRAKDVAA